MRNAGYRILTGNHDLHFHFLSREYMLGREFSLEIAGQSRLIKRKKFWSSIWCLRAIRHLSNLENRPISSPRTLGNGTKLFVLKRPKKQKPHRE